MSWPAAAVLPGSEAQEDGHTHTNLEDIVHLPMIQEKTKRRKKTHCLMGCSLTHSFGACHRLPQEVSIVGREQGGPGGVVQRQPCLLVPQVCRTLVCPRHSSESGVTHKDNRLVLRHPENSNTGAPEHEGIFVLQEVVLGLFMRTSGTKHEGNSVFHQCFDITSSDRRIQPPCCFLTTSAPAPVEPGSSPRGLNGKCCQLNPDAVSRAFIKPTYQVGIKTTCVLQSNAVSAPVAPKSLFTPLCQALGLGMLITSTLLIPWHLLADCCSLLLLGHKLPTSKALHVLILSSPCCCRALCLRLSC